MLVEYAENLLKKLPWGAEFEKDQFVKPEFTSLEVLTFCSGEQLFLFFNKFHYFFKSFWPVCCPEFLSHFKYLNFFLNAPKNNKTGSLPLGICLPNYDDVRSNTGFKNVDLGNVCSARSSGAYKQFLTNEDSILFEKIYSKADQVLTGLHELIGHGSGKLFKELDDGSLNYKDVSNPVTGMPVTTHYRKGQSYGSVFGSMASAMEECRAECVSLYLADESIHDVDTQNTRPSLFHELKEADSSSGYPKVEKNKHSNLYEIQQIFGFHGHDAEDSIYCGWLGMCWLGLKALQHYSPEKKVWGAVHGRVIYIYIYIYVF